MPDPHRKRLQHFNEPGHLHFMTFSCYRRLPLLTNALSRSGLGDALNKALVVHDVQLSGFVEVVELEALAKGRNCPLTRNCRL